MRVSMTHTEKTEGIFKKTPFFQVVLNVVFSAEERAIIKMNNLDDLVIINREPSHWFTSKYDAEALALICPLRVSNLLHKNGDLWNVDTQLAVKAYQAQVTDALRALKDYLDGNAEAPQGTTFEL